MPLVVFVVVAGIWEAVVRLREIPPYILPAPSLILETLVRDWALLFA